MDETLLLRFSEVEGAHWWFVTRKRIVNEAIGAESPPLSRILEVGCGTGAFLHNLTQRFPDAVVSGIEPNEAAAAAARRCGGTVTCGTLETIPSSLNESVHLLVALDVIEHCEDDVAALRSASRVMAPGARLVLTVPALPSLWGPHDTVNRHYRRYTVRTLAEALESANFVVDRLTYFNLLLLPLGYLTRLLGRVTGSRALSGVELPHPWLNAALTAAFSLEVRLLRAVDLPIGMSLLAVAHTPEGAET